MLCSISVPTGAKEARLRWDVAKSQEGWYLAIDDVKVTAIPLLGLALPFFESFNDRSQMNLPFGFSSAGSGNYFGLTGGDTIDFGGDLPSGIGNYTSGLDGSFLVAEDVDDSGIGNKVAIVEWLDIRTRGAECILFGGRFAEALASDGNDDIDRLDYVHVEYSLGGSPWTPLLHFVGANTLFSGKFYPSPGFDGVADTTDVGLAPDARTFTAYTAPVRGVETVSLRLIISVDASNEDVAVDSFSLSAVFCPRTPTLPPTTSTPMPELSLPLFESFDNTNQVILSNEFSGSGSDYFGIANGDNSDFGDGTPTVVAYMGALRLCRL